MSFIMVKLMTNQSNRNEKKIINRLKGRAGMTMAEVLTVVAIIIILAGVAFIALSAYQRSLAQLERDGVAKEIFIAAQNHLTMAKGEGYGSLDETIKNAADEDAQRQIVYGRPGNTQGESGVYYFVVNGEDSGTAVSDFTDSNSSLLDLMLPFGSVDDTVRLGGSYIIRYQPKTATVLDVFYCSKSGNPQKFNHTVTTGELGSFLGLRDTETANHKSDRRTYTDGSVLGWYGSAEAASLPTVSLNTPSIKVVNGDMLYVEITDYNGAKAEGELKLIITGLTSNAKKAIPIRSKTVDVSSDVRFTRLTASPGQDEDEPPSVSYRYVLDDVTVSGRHFGQIDADTTEKFIAGEDIKIEVVAYSSTAFANIAYGDAATENSLYASIADTAVVDINKDGNPLYPKQPADQLLMHAYVTSIRHLENLDKDVSNTGYASNDPTARQITIAAASQTDHLDYDTFIDDLSSSDPLVGTSGSEVYTFDNDGKGGYYPVSPDYSLTYDGLRYSISNVKTADSGSDVPGNAGLFGSFLSTGSISSKIKNLELKDFVITGKENAGALAGVVGSTKIYNVIAYNSDENKSTSDEFSPYEPTVTVSDNSGNAGGLVGSMNGGEIRYCGAALVVTGKASAGGLIGAVTGTTDVQACYSGGHTNYAEYYKHEKNGNGTYKEERQVVSEKTVPIYNVTASDSDGSAAGGLIGKSGSAVIKNSYSTCSVSAGDNGTAGGFIGSASGGTVTHCYSAGLVYDQWQTRNVNGENKEVIVNNAFIGSGTPTITTGTGNESYYYEIVGEYETKDNSGMGYKGPGINDVNPLDASFTDSESKTVYNSFVGGDVVWNAAIPYDNTLERYYKTTDNNKTVLAYDLMTVTQLEESEGTSAAKNDIESSGNPHEKGSLFVNTHYGDWPAPEIFIINP